ncbi:Oligoendopeptidase F [Lachnospiraceae bacterium TWA4]|nr:Oligoendopeptidase F [Lachnospiraceae bacterium TWA4]
MSNSTNTLPTRDEINVNDTWDLTPLFASDALWEQELEALTNDLSIYEKYKSHLHESADILWNCLSDDDRLCKRLETIYSYAHQKQDQDTSNAKYQEFYGKAYELYTKMLSVSSFITVEITAMGKELLEQRICEKNELELYRRSFEVILKQSDHTLAQNEESLLARSHGFSAAASDIFKMFNNADIKFEPALDCKGESHPLTHGTYVRLLESSDRTLRKNAYESLYTAYGQFRNTLAAMYESNLKRFAFYGQVRGYKSPIEYALHGNEIPTKVYDQLIEAVHEGLPSMYEYVKLRKKALGVDHLKMYDVYTPIVSDFQRTYTFEEAKELALKALAPMGEEYIALLKEGFDNRWIDVYENKGKRSGAYSTGSYGTHPYVLLNFTGSLNDVFTLVHEMGHSLHTWYSHHNQPYVYADYKIFVAEVASTCNETLLSKYLLEHAQSNEEKAYIINNFLDSVKGTIFRQTMFAEFEKITHEKVWAGETLTADKLCSIYHKLNEEYFGPDMEVDEFIDMEWARIPHFYTPFYVYQYATGLSAAIALSERILTLGEDGVNDYKKFLKGGSSKTPIELLQIAGVDMTTKQPVLDALKNFSNYLAFIKKYDII